MQAHTVSLTIQAAAPQLQGVDLASVAENIPDVIWLVDIKFGSLAVVASAASFAAGFCLLTQKL